VIFTDRQTKLDERQNATYLLTLRPKTEEDIVDAKEFVEENEK